MTDTQVTEAPAGTTPVHDEKAETVPQKQIPAVDELGFLGKALVEKANEAMSSLKVIAEKQAKVGDVGKLLSEAIQNSDNPEVKKLLGVIEKAHNAINRATQEAENLVKPTLEIPSEEALKDMDTEYKTLATEINALNVVFSNEVQKVHPDLNLFDYTGELPGKRKGAKAGQGTGMSRPRVTSVEYTTDQKGEDGYTKVEKDGKSTFSLLAGALKSVTGETIGAGDFHEEWFKQNGVKDVAEMPEVSKFTYSVTDANGKVHQFWIRVTK